MGIHQPAGSTIYVDELQTNINGELAVSDFLHIHQARSPVIRTEYVEVQEIGKLSYRSMHTVIKVGKNWLPIIARFIPGVSVPCTLLFLQLPNPFYSFPTLKYGSQWKKVQRQGFSVNLNILHPQPLLLQCNLVEREY